MSTKRAKRPTSDKTGTKTPDKRSRTTEEEPDATNDGTASNSHPHGNSSSRLKQAFFERPCEELAKALLGKKFVRKLEDGTVLEAQIVETEAYLGGEDKAAHSHNGKRTDRNEAMYMKPGTIYVYDIYGMYSCINISSQGQ